MQRGLSYTEEQYREQLLSSAERLRSTERGQSILNAVPKNLCPIRSAYVLRALEDQTDEWLLVLVNGTTCVSMERDTWPELTQWKVSAQPVGEYRKGLRKQEAIQVDMAIALHSELESPNNSLQARRP